MTINQLQFTTAEGNSFNLLTIRVGKGIMAGSPRFSAKTAAIFPMVNLFFSIIFGDFVC